MPGSTSITLASWRAPCPCWETSGRARLRRQQRVVTSSLPGSSILRTTLPSTTLVSRWPITTLLGYGRNSASQTCAVDAGRHHCLACSTARSMLTVLTPILFRICRECPMPLDCVSGFQLDTSSGCALDRRGWRAGRTATRLAALAF